MNATIPNAIIPENPMGSAAPGDPVAVARTILADRRKAFTVSTVNLFAICQALVDKADHPDPVITDDLALAARALIAVHDGYAQRAEKLGHAQAGAVSDAAFKAFKTQFETEFPL